jgi:hypothetical protein
LHTIFKTAPFWGSFFLPKTLTEHFVYKFASYVKQNLSLPSEIKGKNYGNYKEIALKIETNG